MILIADLLAAPRQRCCPVRAFLPERDRGRAAACAVCLRGVRSPALSRARELDRTFSGGLARHTPVIF
jgi:hypothetical protein